MILRTLFPLVAGGLCALSLTRYAWLQYGPQASHPRFQCDQAVADLGTVPVGEERHYAFQIHNSGREPLEVKAMAACTVCTRLPSPTLNVPPGQAAPLPVRLATAGQRKGHQTYRILLVTNDPEHQHVILQMTGELIQPR